MNPFITLKKGISYLKHVEIPIALSILGFEEELRNVIGTLAESPIMQKIRVLSLGVEGIHIDLVRPPYSDHSRFPDDLIDDLVPCLSGIPTGLHIMAPDPVRLIRKLGCLSLMKPAPVVTVHREAFEGWREASGVLREIRDLGLSPGVTLDLPTPAEALQPEVVEEADLIQVMSVPAGKGGQRFRGEAISKISRLKRAYPGKPLEVDGGINDETGKKALEAGADRLVVGSFITRSSDPMATLESLRIKLSSA